MSSNPEGGLSKRKQNRLTLKTALAAATLAFASPAPANAQATQENHTTVRSIDTEGQDKDLHRTLNAARQVIQREKEESQVHRRLFGDREFLRQIDKSIADAENSLSSKEYLRGLEKIEQYGGDIRNFIVSTSPEIIKDGQKIDGLLTRIPKELRDNVLLLSPDLKDDPGYSYARPELSDTARILAENHIRLGIGEIHEILDFKNKSPSFVSDFTSIIASSHGKIHPRLLMGSVRGGVLTAEDVSNEKIRSGLSKLVEGGLQLYQVVPDQSDESARQDMLRKLGDPSFIEAYLGLSRLGYRPDHRTFRDMPLETVMSPNFLKNAQLLRQAGAVDSSPENLVTPLKLDGLEVITKTIPPNKLYDGMLLYFIKKIGDDPEAWTAVRNFYMRYPNDDVAQKSIQALDLHHLKSESFLAILNTILQTNKARDPFGNRFDAERAFIKQETGKDRFEITRSLENYLGVTQDPSIDPLVAKILEREEGIAYLSPVLRMNELHDESAVRRLEVIRPFNARTIFEVMRRAGADAYLSTFRFLYNGNGFTGREAQNSFLVKVRTEHGTLSTFFQTLRPDHKTFGTFLELLSQNGILDAFLSDVGSADEQQSMLREFLFNASSGISNTQALTLSDLLNTTKAEPIRAFVFGELRTIQGKQQLSQKDKSPKVAGLLIADYFQGKQNVPEWALPSVQEYRKFFPEIRELSEDKVFRKEGEIKRNVQVHFFYDDRAPGKPESTWDGHASFRNFITSLGGSVTWDKDGTIQRITVNQGYDVKDEGDYVVIRQADSRTKREVVMYAIKPDRTDETVAKVGGQLLKEKQAPMATLRGHSFHAGKMIGVLTPDVVMVNLGSCGGAKNISDVLAKAPEAQVMATRGVGTMLVNDVVIPSINRDLLRNGNVNWGSFSVQMTVEMDRRGGLAKERWPSYQPPDKNKTAHLIAALKALEK
ncbi:hypothetical protein HYW59_03880 [Candidatus Kaiserbacteria bacterium]|nr:hypothetical protein [Candidatus Kaiserbacteria bacterium]